MTPVKFESEVSWISLQNQKSQTFDQDSNQISVYTLAEEVGKGHRITFRLFSDALIHLDALELNHLSGKQRIRLATVKTQFDQPTLVIHSIIIGQVLRIDLKDHGELPLNTNSDLIFYGKSSACQYEIGDTREHHPAQDQFISLTLQITCKRLEFLLGADTTALLLQLFSLENNDQTHSFLLSPLIRKALHDCAHYAQQGELNIVQAHMSLLEFLSLLLEHLIILRDKKARSADGEARVKKVYDYLIALDGKVPKLKPLALKYCCTEEDLKREFSQTYNKTITGFATERRWQIAKAMIVDGKVLKFISEEIGYANVNNFNAAFKKHVGMSPGAYRKTLTG